MKKRFISFLLAFCILVSYPLQCSALGLSDYFESYDNLIDYLTYLEETALETVKITYDYTFGDNSFIPWSDWIDGFHKIDNSDWGVPTDPSLGIGSSSGSGSSGGCNLIYIPYDYDYYFCEHSPDLSCALTLSSMLYPNSSGKIIVALPDFSDYIIINFSKSPDSDNCHVLSSTSYYGVLDLFLNGSYNGDVSFTVVDCCSYKDRGFTKNPFPQYSNYFTHRIKADWTTSIGYADFYKLIRNFSGSSDRYLAYTDFPIYDRYTNDLVNEGQPSLDFDSAYMIHPASKWSGSTDKYIVDAKLWFTGDPSSFDPDDYTASAGLVYTDSSSGSNYLPSDYVFFDRLGSGKVDSMDAPACVFHFHLDQIKDWIIKKRLSPGNFYIFIGCFNKNNDAVYYKQYQLDLSMVDDSMFSGLTDFPDWDDYSPDDVDNSQTPTITINNYNDYETFETAPSTFDFAAYAEWMYTNLSIMNDNIGTLNDNLVLFFHAFEDFTSDFYTYFNSKFSHLFSLMGDLSDSFADYLKDTCKTIVFNLNVIADNMISSFKNLFQPDDTDISFILMHFLPWYNDLTVAFGQLLGNSSSSNGPQLSPANGAQLNSSDPVQEGFSIYLPVGFDDNLFNQTMGECVIWKEKYFPIETFYNEDVYNMLTYIIYAAGFFTCVRLGFSIFGIGFGSAISSQIDDDEKSKKR